MTRELEHLPRDSENSELDPTDTHELYIEEQSSDETRERAKWLQGVYGVGFEGRFDADNPVDTRDSEDSLNEWEETLPEHSELLHELRGSLNHDKGTGTTLPEVAITALKTKDRGKLDELQSLSKDLIKRFGTDSGRAGWQELPEKNKRYVRIAEMTILMTDTFKAVEDLDAGRANDSTIDRLNRRMEVFASSTDLPDGFKVKFLDLVKAAQRNEQTVESAAKDRKTGGSGDGQSYSPARKSGGSDVVIPQDQLKRLPGPDTSSSPTPDPSQQDGPATPDA